MDKDFLQNSLLILKQNFWIILLFTLLITTMATIYAYSVTPVFSSSVTLSIDNGQNAKRQAVIPGSLGANEEEDKRIETLQITLKSKKFILSALEKLTIENRYFIKNLYRDVEIDKFKNLDINLTVLNPKILNKKIEIIPKSRRTYTLKIDDILYEKEYQYNDKVNHRYFTLTTHKTGILEYKNYLFVKQSRESIVDSILENLNIESVNGNIIEIIYNDTLPKRTQKIVECIAKEFIHYSLDKKSKEIQETSKFLNRQIDEIKNSLNNEGEALKNYQEKNKIIIAKETGSTLYKKITQKSEKLQTLKFKLQNIQKFKRELKESNKLNTVSLIDSGINITSIQSIIENYRKEESQLEEMLFQRNDISKQMTQNTKLNQLIEKIENKKFEISQLRINFTAEHPEIIALKKDIYNLTHQIENYINKNIYKARKMKNRWKSKILSNIIVTEKSLQKKISLLQKNIKKNKKLFESFPQKSLEIEDLNRKFKLNEQVYTFLLQKKLEIDMKYASTLANTVILRDAPLPSYPMNMNQKMIIAAAFLMGLIFSSLGLIFFKETLNDKIKNESDIEKIIDDSIYGIVPQKTNHNLSYFKEAFKSIRTNLYLTLFSNKRCNNILISSSILGEGKTTISAALGASIAQSDKSVLLIDCDLRKPRLHQELNCENNRGISDLLTHDINIDSIIQNIDTNLDFLSAGSIKDNPTELLMTQKLKYLIDILMDRYDCILFDSAPIGTVTDTSLLLQYTDIFLLVVKVDYLKKSDLEHFNQIIKKKREIESMGIIVNGIKLKKNGHRYDNGYNYNYSYGKD